MWPFLLKPFTFERFLTAVDKVQSNLSSKQSEKNFIFIKTEYRLEKLFLNEILYIEGMRDYRRIHTVNKKIMTLKTFNDFEREIPATRICRVHKSYMVSLDKIDSIERNRIRIKETMIPMSETYKKKFISLIGEPLA
ncbi:MAG: DNA-binding response regulator [Bacteroidota bacterium]|jgi:DNA-binding LytR/AlgR family response regulator|nr:DNA-binding response regulator [Bacteroidota bacterium]